MTNTTDIATTTWQQISTMTKMACGAREPVASGNTLRFKVGGRLRWVEVELTPADTYTVRLVTLRGGKYGERVVVEELEGVYCDNLSGIVYRVCNK